MKPFNLERALAGDPIFTSDGRRVVDLHIFPSIPEFVCGVISGTMTPILWYLDGRSFPCVRGTDKYDLVMGSNKYYVNIYSRKSYEHPNGQFYTGRIFSTKKDAMDEYWFVDGSTDPNYVKTIEVEI